MKVFLILLMLLSSVFGERNPLLNLNDSVRNVTHNLVDLGTKSDISDIETSLNVQLRSVPALVKDIEAAFQYSGRDITEENCVIDEFGHQFCPTDAVACTANNVFDPGTATKHTVVLYANKIKKIIPSYEESGYRYFWLARCASKSYAATMVYTGNKETLPLSTVTCGDYYPNPVNKICSSSSDRNKCAIIDTSLTPNPLHNQDGVLNYVINAYTKGSLWGSEEFYGGSLMPFWKQYVPLYPKIYNSNYKGWYLLKEAYVLTHPAVTTYVCPAGYTDNGSNCKKEYTYYTYQCPTTVNEFNQGWQGPLVSAGGDCNGIGVSAAVGGTCPGQSATPPAKNCLRVDQSCPFNNQDCTQISTGEVVTENNFNGYEYSIGLSEEFTNTKKIGVTCPISDNETLECPSGYEPKDDGCIKEIIDIDDISMETINGKCPNTHFLAYDKCFQNNPFGNYVVKENDIYFYYMSQAANYDETLKLCASNKSTECRDPNAILYEDKCIYTPGCSIFANGDCYEKPTRQCGQGYVFNEIKKECISTPTCLTGTLKPVVSSAGVTTFICESTSTQCRTTGFIPDQYAAGFCSTNMITEAGKCGVFDAAVNYCNTQISYNLWTEAGSDSNWRMIIDFEGDQAMFQSVNTGAYAFYIFPTILNTFSLEGKIAVDSTCGGDDDSIGLFFGYKDTSNFYALLWSRGNYNSGGTGIGGGANIGLRLVRVVNGVITELGSKADSFGWLCGKYSKFKLTYADNKIMVYKDNVLMFDVLENVNSGKAGYFGYSQKNALYKDFTLMEEPKCSDSTKIYDANQNICYKQYPGTGYIYDFDNKLVLEPAGCGTGTYNIATNSCESSPSCSGGGKLGTFNNSQICSLKATFKCSSDNLLYVNDDFTKTLFSNNSEYLEGACKVINPCPAGEDSFYVDGIKHCSNTNFNIKCQEGYIPFNVNGEDKCIATPTCPDGYTKNGTTCELNYSWYEYSCPAGYEGPNEIWDKNIDGTQEKYGGDCDAACGFDGCKCNSENAPANSCRKAVTFNPNSVTSTKILKEKMMTHNISGQTLGVDDMGLLRGVQCTSGDNKCQFAVNEIYGDDSDLCFVKTNGEKSCFTVDGCYFNGSISEEYGIANLKVPNPYVISYEEPTIDVGPPTTCIIGTFDPVTKKCSGTIPFENWTKEGAPASGAWSIRTMEGEQEIYQANNLLNTMYMYPDPLPNHYKISGQIKARIAHQNSIGLIFGWESDSSLYEIDWGGDGHWCKNYGNCGLAGGTYGNLQIIKVISSQEAYGTYHRKNSTILAKNASQPNWVPNVWYNISAEVNGGNVKVFINDIKYIDYTLPNGAVFPEGRVGFFNLSTPGVSYRRFRVDNLEPVCPDNTYYSEETTNCHKYECPKGMILDTEDKVCKQQITSSCKINGNVGWQDRDGEIVSVGVSGEEGARFMARITGYADSGDGSKWHGFNAATMALKLSDGNWYRIANVLDKQLKPVAVSSPKAIQTLANNYFSIANDVPNTKCIYKGIELSPSFCGSSLVLKMPEKHLKVVAIADINSLYGLYGTPISSGNINLELNYSSTTDKVYLLGGIQELNPKYTSIINNVEMSELTNRLRFWDSYIDGYIGFLEFVNEVKPEYRTQGFIPEFFDYELAMGMGFTTIGVFSENDGFLSETEASAAGYTYFVKPTPTTVTECKNYATKLNLTVTAAPSGTIANNKLSNIMAMKYPGACVLGKTGIITPNMSEWSIKTQLVSGPVAYKCSPYLCNDYKCKTAECKDGYHGKTLPQSTIQDNLTSGKCMDDTCDALKPFFTLCGKPGGCDISKTGISQDENGNCKELYCEEGYLDADGVTCKIEFCPSGSHKEDGKCIKD